jgi:hypothetical protein
VRAASHLVPLASRDDLVTVGTIAQGGFGSVRKLSGLTRREPVAWRGRNDGMTVRSCVGCLAVGVLLALTGCGAAAESQGEFSIFLKRHQDGQLVPVLAATTREQAEDVITAGAVLSELVAGPTDAEKRDGFRPSFPSSARILSVRVEGSRADLNISGLSPDDFHAAAATVYSLTELPGVESVSLHLDGKPCCVYDQQSNAIDPLRRNLFRGWPGEPCELRTYTDAVACRE